MRAKFHRIIARYHEGGITLLARSLARSVCDYQIQEFRGRIIADQDPPFSPQEHNSSPLVCTVITPETSLEPFAAEFTLPLRDSFETLERRLAGGCILILARRPLEAAGHYEVVGYSIMEAGAFSAAGVHGKIPQDIMFVHYTEVTRKYRGQRIAERISRARNEYYRASGIQKSCNAHSPSNIASERAFRKFGSDLLCYVIRISFFRGSYIWQTSSKRIERALVKLEQRFASRVSTSSSAAHTVSESSV